MKLRELITELQRVEAERGGEVLVDVGLSHTEDGLCTKELEQVDADWPGDALLLYGGDIELAPGITLPAASGVTREILEERYRQQQEDGWTPAREDQQTGGDLAQVAAAYALGNRRVWPFSRRRALIKAAALLVAEIERLDRAEDQAEAGA